MRNIGNKTPTTKPEQIQTTSGKSSGKKLVQARLPFKIIGSGVLLAASSDVINAEAEGAGSTANQLCEEGQTESVCKQDARKRKLSYGQEEGASTELPLVDSKENVSVATTKKKKTSTSQDVIVLVDSEKEDEEGTINVTEKDANRISLATPKASSKTPSQGSKKRKGAGTPKSAGGSGGVRGKQSPRGSVPKLQIKLPITGKKKRRKSQRKSITGDVESTSEASSESSDDIEIIAEELNPQKRLKVETPTKVNIKDQKKELDETREIKAHTKDLAKSPVKTPVRQSTRKSVVTEDLPQNDQNKPKINKFEDIKDIKSTNSEANKDTKSTKSKEKKDAETSAENIEKPDVQNISDEEDVVVETTSMNVSKSSEGKKSMQTLDEFISKGNVSAQQEKTNTKQVGLKNKVPKPKKVSEKFKSSITVKNANVSTVDDADDDEDAVNSSASSVVEVNENDIKEKSVERNSNVTDSPGPANVSELKSSNISVYHSKGGLTPKQQKLMEQRRMAREEKERRLQEQKEERERKTQEEKLQKQREKDEKELAKKREREEKEEQKRKEREEKEEVKRKEREEKERKRLAEIDAKNEERRKRNEVKEEELRKKDEERKRKEQEKEEAEHKKKKAAEAFTKFFVPKNTRLTKAPEAVEQASVHEGVEGVSVGENARSESLAFRPFQIKGDMKLAPLCRKIFNDAAREKLEFFLNAAPSIEKFHGSPKNASGSRQLYLDELKTGKIVPGKWRRPTVDTKSDDDDDVVIIEDELERAAQTIVEESGRTFERYRAKLYKFHENRRPPYFGTWRKKTSLISARRPLAQDKKYFDYEVDSDLEWEEEEPGESLDGSDEEKEKESEDEDYEVDNEWFVPHGHLSDEELQNEDECGLGDDNTREAQKAKLKILQQEFAQEMKKKTEKIKPRLIGCIWQDCNGNQPELCPNIIWNSLNLRAMLYTTPPLVEEPIVDSVGETNEPSSPTNSTSAAGTTEKLKRILLTEEMIKDLIRLVHGNRHSKVFLINEFIAHIEQTENAIKNGDVRGPLKSVVRDKIDEFALWQIVESNNNSKNKKKNKKKLCWLVSEEKLKKYNLQSLELHNKWTYTLPPKFVDTNLNSVNESLLNEEKVTEVSESKASDNITPSTSNSKKISKRKADVITKFTKVLTTEEKAKQIQQNVVASKIDKATKAQTTNRRSTSKSASSPATTSQEQSTTPIVKKRVPLLMSVARGQQIPTPTKNALISQFLKKGKNTPESTATSALASTKMDVDEVVILD